MKRIHTGGSSVSIDEDGLKCENNNYAVSIIYFLLGDIEPETEWCHPLWVDSDLIIFFLYISFLFRLT